MFIYNQFIDRSQRTRTEGAQNGRAKCQISPRVFLLSFETIKEGKKLHITTKIFVISNIFLLVFFSNQPNYIRGRERERLQRHFVLYKKICHIEAVFLNSIQKFPNCYETFQSSESEKNSCRVKQVFIRNSRLRFFDKN